MMSFILWCCLNTSLRYIAQAKPFELGSKYANKYQISKPVYDMWHLFGNFGSFFFLFAILFFWQPTAKGCKNENRGFEWMTIWQINELAIGSAQMFPFNLCHFLTAVNSSKNSSFPPFKSYL